MIRRKLNQAGTWLLVAEIRLIIWVVNRSPAIPMPDFSKLFPRVRLPELEDSGE